MTKKPQAKVQKASGTGIATDRQPWPYVEVQWHDATSESQWKSSDNLPNVSAIITRGWLVRQTKRCITVAGSVGAIDEKPDGEIASLDVGEIITIPRGCVIDIFELKVVRTPKRRVTLN